MSSSRSQLQRSKWSLKTAAVVSIAVYVLLAHFYLVTRLVDEFMVRTKKVDESEQMSLLPSKNDGGEKNDVSVAQPCIERNHSRFSPDQTATNDNDNNDNDNINTLETAESSLKDVPSDLFQDLCDPNIIGEKQADNRYKKVIAYSLFTPETGSFDSKRYLEGMITNSNLARMYYPDYILQIYTVGLSEEIIQDLISLNNVEVIKCERQDSLYKNAMMRFMAIDHPRNWIVLVRDSDSHFSFREIMAVNEWISSAYSFHIMRDHEWHGIEVLAGMFGMKRPFLKNVNTTMGELVKNALVNHQGKSLPGYTEDDQHFLTSYVWKLVKDDTLGHDMDLKRCKRYGSKVCIDFPLGPRSEECYVGRAVKVGHPPRICFFNETRNSTLV